MSEAAQTITATEAICAVAELSGKAVALMKPEYHPREFTRLLADKNLFPDAVRFLAHGMPKREAVWWAWFCARRADPDPEPEVKAALAATESWIAQPTDDNGRTAHAAAKAVGLGTPAGCAGLAAFFCGSSLGPPHVQAIPPGEYLYAKAVSGAVIFAAVSSEPEKAPEKFNNYLAQGMEITVKIKLWEPK